MKSVLKETDYLKGWALFLLLLWAGYFVAELVGGVAGGLTGIAGGSTHSVILAGRAGGLFVAIVGSYLSFRFTVSRIVLRRLRKNQFEVF